MCAIYAFMRYSDDVSDGDTLAVGQSGVTDSAPARTREEEMIAWRAALERAFLGEYGESLILPAFHDTVLRYGIPQRYFHELIDGTEMDFTKTRYATWEELHLYCYRVASIVGFVCIHVWGFDEADGRTLEYAEACGLALQLTNILRDVKEDVGRDRIYLPQEDLDRFGVTEASLREGVVDDRFRALMRFEAERAEEFYRQARQLFPLIDRAGRPTLTIMIDIYHGILECIVRNRYDVYRERARVSTPKKLAIVGAAWLRGRLGLGKP